VRTDCHVQVRRNFNSVPYQLVGKTVVARVDATSVVIYIDFAVVARHERRLGRGESVTKREHYPEHKRKSTQEIRHERIARIRSVGGGTAALSGGLLRSREHVHCDALRAILDRRLFDLQLDDLSLTPTAPAPQIALVRPLAAYAELLGGGRC
jgi:hypothetical protein